MHTRLLIFILCIFTLWSCKKDDPEILQISDKTLAFTSQGGSKQINVTANNSYTVIGEKEWCKVVKSTNGEQLTVTATENITQQQRSADITLLGRDNRQVIRVTQDKASTVYQYQIPVVFHVLYNNASSDAENIPASTLNNLVSECNKIYRDNINSVDMKVQFVLATTDPKGQQLATPGIERIQWPSPITISCETFMNSKDKTYVDLIWDPNSYINIMVYRFQESNVSGISHLAYTTSANPLEGLLPGDRYFSIPVNYPHCISINNKFIFDDEAPVTLAHEMGHYLGLFHAFADSTCVDTDYCKDTPTYNRKEYQEWLANITSVTLQQAAQRTNCQGETFISYNIMDYFYSYLNQFTPNQHDRIRFVLENSPLIPGPKSTRATTRSAEDYPIPPIRVMI